MWAFKTCGTRASFTKGSGSYPTRGRCETPLSHAETRIDDSTGTREDPALDGRVRTPEPDSRRAGLLAWTTTPWTLPSNLALCVGPDIEYAVLERRSTCIHRCDAVERTRRESANAESLQTRRQVATLLGSSYRPLVRRSSRVADQEQAFRVLAADFVTTEDGTGVVHMSPGHGEDDQRVCNAAGIRTVVPMDEHGPLHVRGTAVGGAARLRCQPAVIRDLKARARAASRDLRPPVPALLAVRHATRVRAITAGSSR